MGTDIKHPVPDVVKPSFVIFDTRSLWRSAVSVRVPGCQKLQMTANPVWHVYRILYSCTHMATLGVKRIFVEGWARRVVWDGLHVADGSVSLPNGRHRQNRRLLSSDSGLRVSLQVSVLEILLLSSCLTIIIIHMHNSCNSSLLERWWWPGLVVARWSRSTKLTYAGPG